MLVRTLVAADPVGRSERLESLLDRRDVVVLKRDAALPLDEQVERDDIDLVLTDGSGLDGDLEGWVARARGGGEGPEVLVLVDGEDGSRRARLLAAGALAVLNLRLSDAELRRALRAVARRPRDSVAVRREAESHARTRALDTLVSVSAAMGDLVDMARRVADSDSSILLLGETGVGKERLARAIHQESRRRHGPFVPVNCGAIPEGLLESELFGHEQGAFTGAMRGRRGHFEMAHQGTIFLDEIGELPLNLQVKLLRALEDREIQRLGSEERIRLDVRILAATNRNLEQEVHEGRFRADLFYRLAVVSLTVPALRDRPEDVAALVASQLERFGPALGKTGITISAEALAALQAYPWPGNVRELINVVERAVLLARGPVIEPADLPRSVAEAVPRHEGDTEGATGASVVPPIRDARRRAVDAFERRYLRDLLSRTGGRINEAARLAGINQRSLFDLLKRHGIRKEEFRSGG